MKRLQVGKLSDRLANFLKMEKFLLKESGAGVRGGFIYRNLQQIVRQGQIFQFLISPVAEHIAELQQPVAGDIDMRELGAGAEGALRYTLNSVSAEVEDLDLHQGVQLVNLHKQSIIRTCHRIVVGKE